MNIQNTLHKPGSKLVFYRPRKEAYWNFTVGLILELKATEYAKVYRGRWDSVVTSYDDATPQKIEKKAKKHLEYFRFYKFSNLDIIKVEIYDREVKPYQRSIFTGREHGIAVKNETGGDTGWIPLILNEIEVIDLDKIFPDQSWTIIGEDPIEQSPTKQSSEKGDYTQIKFITQLLLE